MGTKKKVPAKAARGQKGGGGQAPPKLNPFELRGTKRKFEVLGRREKTEKKSVIASREAAVAKRKKTLLVEYRQLRKANTFIDRRFGEDDPRLDEEDRALARFQAQRVREARREAKFALADDGDAGRYGDGSLGGPVLTHGGRSLEELEDLSGRPDDLADLDDAELAELERELHFGGGEEGGGDGDGDGGRRQKSRKEIMEEIIAKSKAFKAARQMQKDEDEAAIDRLDGAFRELVGATAARGGVGAAAVRGAAKGGVLASLLKPPGFDKGVRVAPDDPDDAAYDRAARELVFEAKGHAGERTLMPEELQERERLRLEALEKQRLKRMRGDGGDDDEEEEDGGAGGGFAARRKKRQMESGDALDNENYELSEDGDEDGSGDHGDGGGAGGGDLEGLLSALDERRRERAAGDHPLQEAFRETAARLAAKHGVEVPGAGDGSSGSEEEEGESGEGDGEEGGSSGSGEEEGEEGGSGSEGEEQVDEEGEKEEGAADGDDARRRSHREAGASGAAARAPPAGAGRRPELEGPLDLPFTIPVPQRYEQFAALVAGRPAEELALAVQRIRAFNAAALATDNKRQLQLLYGILVQHFAMVAGESPVPVAHLDALTRALVASTPEVPYYAVTVARARLTKMHDQLSAALRDPAAAPRAGWPGARQLLQLRLFCLLFPVTDKRHPVVTPLALLLGKYLAQCPVTGPYDAALGAAVAGMALQAAAPAGRCVPEAVSFVAAALGAFALAESGSDSGSGKALARQQEQVASLFAPGCLAFSAEARAGGKAKGGKAKGGKGGSGDNSAALPPLQLYPLLSLPPRDASCATDAFRERLLGCLVATARAAAASASEHYSPALPPLLGPVLTAADSLLSGGALPAGAPRAAVAALVRELRSACDAAVAARTPLVQSFRVKTRAPKEYTPRFEEDFHSKGDYDHDRARADRKKLQRAVVKEKRGAMRELRRDAAFMASARDAERAAVDAERLASQRKFYAELDAQEADFRSGGQRGMHKGKKKAK